MKLTSYHGILRIPTRVSVRISIGLAVGVNPSSSARHSPIEAGAGGSSDTPDR